MSTRLRHGKQCARSRNNAGGGRGQTISIGSRGRHPIGNRFVSIGLLNSWLAGGRKSAAAGYETRANGEIELVAPGEDVSNGA